MNIKELTDNAMKFRDEREWKQFHNPKDLAISLNIEAGELLEWFQWKDNDEVNRSLNSEKKVNLQEEIGDVAIYLMMLAYETGIDIEEAIIDKLKKNEIKYPIEKSNGNSKKYNEL